MGGSDKTSPCEVKIPFSKMTSDLFVQLRTLPYIHGVSLFLSMETHAKIIFPTVILNPRFVSVLFFIILSTIQPSLLLCMEGLFFINSTWSNVILSFSYSSLVTCFSRSRTLAMTAFNDVPWLMYLCWDLYTKYCVRLVLLSKFQSLFETGQCLQCSDQELVCAESAKNAVCTTLSTKRDGLFSGIIYSE